MSLKVIKGGLDFPICPASITPLINRLIAMRSLVGLIRTLNRGLIVDLDSPGSLEFRVGEIEGAACDVEEHLDSLMRAIRLGKPCPGLDKS